MTDPTPITVNVAAPILMGWIVGAALIIAALSAFAAFVAWMVADDQDADRPWIIAAIAFIATTAIGIVTTILLYGVEWEHYRRLTGRN